MDERRQAQLRKLNPRYILPDGDYLVLDRQGNHVSIIKLTAEDIMYLRYYYGDKNIASEVLVPIDTRKQSDSNVKNKTSSKRSLKISRNQKYNKTGYKIKGTIKNIGKIVVIFGIIVCVAVPMFNICCNPTEYEPDVPQDGVYVTQYDDLGDEYGKYMDAPSFSEFEEVDQDYVQQVKRAEFIRILCQIFQVDYQVTYNKLVQMTDNFADSEYLAGRHSLVTCKGMKIDADTEEEFLVYAVRIIAQDPSRVDLSEREVCINNGYTSGNNYNEIIAKWSSIIEVDPALVYGIMQAETGWCSKLFIEDNNPAGLKNGSEFWIFKNKEAGIIELMMEIVKYRYNGATTIEEIAKIHCPLDDPDDVNNLNKNWVSNVTAGYEQGREIFEAMGYYENNGLSY